MNKWVIRQLIPLIRFLGKVHAPWITKKITSEDYDSIQSVMRPGDILTSKTEGYLTNILIPGYWKHSAIIGQDQRIVEAVGEGVREVDLFTFLCSKDEVALLRPTFCSDEEALLAFEAAEVLVGCPYDYEFSLGNKAFYCAELLYLSYKLIVPDKFLFYPRERLGVKTITADDFFNAADWFQVLYDSRGV